MSTFDTTQTPAPTKKTRKSKKEVLEAAAQGSTPEACTPSSEPHLITEPYFHYFLVAGELEYIEGKFNKAPKYRKVSGVYRSPIQGMTAKELAEVQVNLQMQFHRQYARTHGDPANVTNLVLLSSSYIGFFTESAFMEGAPKEQEQKEEQPSDSNENQQNVSKAL